jgi:hypothetical protein
MTKLPGFSCSAPVVVGSRVFAACGTSDLVCFDKTDGKIQWLTTLTPCDAATDADKAAPGYKENVEPLAAQLKAAGESLVKDINSLSALKGVPADVQGKLDAAIKHKHELEKKLHDALKAIDPKKYVVLYGNEVSGTDGTPITDGKRIYVATGGGMKGPGAYVIAAYTLDGQRVWSFHEALGAEEHGNHVSPALVDGKLIYAAHKTVLALDASTGKEVWRSELKFGGPDAVVFVPAKVAATPVLVAHPGRVLQCSDGKLLSEMKNARLFNGDTTPVYDNGTLYLDGERKDLVAVKLPDSASASPSLAWKLDGTQWRLEGSSGFSIASPLIVNGLLYSVDTMGGLAVVELATQKVLYKRRLEMFQRANRQVYGFTASPTQGGKQIYIFDNTGCAISIEPGAEYKETSRNIIENQVAGDWQDFKQELFYASPVFDDASIYVKGGEYLYCMREK